MQPNLQYSSNVKTFLYSLPWWNSTCTDTVKNRSLLCRTKSDFLSYHNTFASTKREIIRNDSAPTSDSIQHIWSMARRFKNGVNLFSCPDNDKWFGDFCYNIASKLLRCMFRLNPKLSLAILIQISPHMSSQLISILQN